MKWIKRQIKSIYHAILWGNYFPQFYKRASRQPLNPNKIIFLEKKGDKLSNNLQLIYSQLEKATKYDLHIHYLHEGTTSNWQYFQNSRRCLKDAATAKTIFLDDGSRLFGCIDLRGGSQIAQVWHGCGVLKRAGLSTIGSEFGTGKEDDLKYPYYANYKVVPVSSPEVVWAHQEGMGIAKDSGIVKPLGVSRTDVFFQEEFQQKAYERIWQQVPATKDKKIILYAPTYRGDIKNAKAPDGLDLIKMKEQLSSEYVILIKQHPFVKNRPLITADIKNFAFDVTDTCTIDDLICVSDICISDYSSLVFEYSLMNRPIIFFAYDLESYDEVRGFYYDYEELTPGPVLKTTKEVIAQIENIDKYDLAKVAKFKERFMSSCDGNATKRLLDFLDL